MNILPNPSGINYTPPHPLDMSHNGLIAFARKLAIMGNPEKLTHTNSFIEKLFLHKERLAKTINDPSKESIKLAIIDILKIRVNAGKAEHIPDTAKNLMFLAQLCSCCIEQPEDATVYAKEALEQAITEGHESIILALSSLEQIYLQNPNQKNAIISTLIESCIVNQKFVIAELLYKQIINDFLNFSLEQYPDRVQHIKKSPMLYIEQDILDRAVGLYLLVIRTCLGLAKTTTSKSENNLKLLVLARYGLADVYTIQGKHQAAEDLYRKVLDESIDQLGAENPASISAKSKLALYYFRQKFYDKAEQLYTEVYQQREQILGKYHLKTLASKSNLASACARQGGDKLRLAVEVYRELLDTYVEHLRGNILDIVMIKIKLAEAYVLQRNFFFAIGLYGDIIHTFQGLNDEQKLKVGLSEDELRSKMDQLIGRTNNS